MPEPLPVRYRTASGSPVISVTQVLTFAGRINTDWFTPESAERGSLVHSLTEAMDRQEPRDIPEHVQGYCLAYARFLALARPRYLRSEWPVMNAEVAGRIDRIVVEWFGQPTEGIIDIKTGPPDPWHGQQLAAYNWLEPHGERHCLYLRKNGTYRLRPYTNPADHRKFLYDLAQVRGTVRMDGDHWVQQAA